MRIALYHVTLINSGELSPSRGAFPWKAEAPVAPSRERIDQTKTARSTINSDGAPSKGTASSSEAHFQPLGRQSVECFSHAAALLARKVGDKLRGTHCGSLNMYVANQPSRLISSMYTYYYLLVRVHAVRLSLKFLFQVYWVRETSWIRLLSLESLS